MSMNSKLMSHLMGQSGLNCEKESSMLTWSHVQQRLNLLLSAFIKGTMYWKTFVDSDKRGSCQLLYCQENLLKTTIGSM